MKTAILTAAVGAIIPVVGTNTFEVLDWDVPVGIVVEFSRPDDKVTLMRRNFAANGWEPVTDGQGSVILSAMRHDFAVTLPDVYGLQGFVSTPITAYKVTV